MPDIYTFYCRLSSNYDSKYINANNAEEAAQIFAEIHHKKTGEGLFSVSVRHGYTCLTYDFEVLVVNKPTYQVKEIAFREEE